MAGFLSNDVPTFYPTDEEASDFEGLIHFMEQSGVHKVEFFRLRLLGFNPCHVTGESCIGCAATRVVPQSNTYVSLQATAIEDGSNETAS